MPGRPRSVSDEAIFEAVTAVISDVGPKGLTLAAVAKRVGLTASALTQRFGSKHGLLVAFATREAANVAGIFAKARATHLDPLTALITTLSTLPTGITTPESLANNLAFLQLDLTDPELRPHAVTQSRALRAEITTLLTEAIEYGLLAPTTSPETLAADLYATYCGAMLTWAIDGTGPLPDWLTQHLERTLAPYLTQSTDATR
ncbi:TetR family transcriptional regulator [Thermopolyspora flexuosa]|uniref:TetR family transcriptional regulator n=1 Tax=Thermopolyspora flexuosa TaxID=103836 RepID=A0A543ISI0_9ACTN|nr:TetR/AcrR family transcriptional regulator [Thermopolyspora flexuosa]TQM73530.1 TetR family transcriptional regulator [Thermopolyspora flexuosa]GGM82003.1 TetR family transcriptional regulator [Thermopolyspora flexuosa]